MSIREQISGDTLLKKQPIVSGLVAATASLSVEQTGSMVFLDKTDGITITLPSAVDVGTFYDFVVVATLLSSAYKVITADTTNEKIVGQITSADTGNSNVTIAYPSLVGSANVSVNMNATTTGGIKGDNFRLTKINATSWLCQGSVSAIGTATLFANS